MSVYVAVFLLLVAGLVVLTVFAVARGRPPRRPQSKWDRARPQARSMRGWQAQINRDIRRRGRR